MRSNKVLDLFSMHSQAEKGLIGGAHRGPIFLDPRLYRRPRTEPMLVRRKWTGVGRIGGVDRLARPIREVRLQPGFVRARLARNKANDIEGVANRQRR